MAPNFNIPGPVDEAIGRKKKQLVNYIKGKVTVSKDAPIRGTSDRQPKYYRGGKKTPFRRP